MQKSNHHDDFELLEEPSEIVVFHRWYRILPYADDFKEIEESRKDEHFMIDQIFNSSTTIAEFQCKAFLHSYFSDSNETLIPLPVSWITDDGKILSKSDVLQIQNLKNDLKFRCKADLKNLEEMIDGSILSRSIYFSKKPYNFVKIKPEIIHAAPGSVVRFACYFPFHNYSTSSTVIWKHNNVILKPSKLLRMGTIKGKSVLHILSASSEHSGGYSCTFIPDSTSSLFESEPSQLDVDKEGETSEGFESPFTLSAPLHGMAMFECLLPGMQGIQWILERRSYEKKGEILPRHDAKVLGNDTILILKNITFKFDGTIKCLVEVANNSLVTSETEFRVFNETYNDALSVFTPIERKQGTAISFRCETYEIFGETPEMAEWSLNGRPIERTPNIKITRSTLYGIGHTDLVIAITEGEDEGLYTCIISNDQHERIHQLLLEVDITTNETIQNLSVKTNHETSCIRLEFDLPPSTDLQWAHFTPFFVVVHETNSTNTLNSLPLMAKCTKKLHCRMDICQSSMVLSDATEYVFRISMVLSGAGTVITPLSKPAIATTWDSYAEKSLPLILSYNETENSITVEWETPKNVKGKVEKFAIQIVNYSEKMSNLFAATVRREHYEREADDRIFQIKNVTNPFAYKIRIIPMTRKPKFPSEVLQLLQYFPFILFTSEQVMASFDSEIPIPEFTVSQVNQSPIVNVNWEIPDKKHQISKIAIKYQHVVTSQAKLIAIERPADDGSAELTRGIEVGLVYQICASFIHESGLQQSAWQCQALPVKNEFNGLIYETMKEAWSKKQLPPAITCENDNCRCFPSKVNEGGLRVEWNEPAPRKNETESNDSLPKPSIQYSVHYTFNETDPSNHEYEFPAEDGDLFAELSGLLPNTTYRIMIETQNDLNDKVDGAFFSCKTSPKAPLPPPKKFDASFINATHLKFTWIPLPEEVAKLSGYTIFWQADNKPVLPIFVPGPSSWFYVIAGMRPEPLYHAHIVSRSSAFVDSSSKSQRLSIRMPPQLAAEFDELDKSSTRSPSFYRDPEVYSTFVFIASTTVAILIFCGLSYILYFWCCLPLWRRREQKRLDALQRGHSNASSKLSLNSGDDAEHALNEMEADETPILIIPPDPPGFSEKILDPQGPPGGPRPLGNRRFRLMIKDENFQKQMHELNSDPTGLGLPAGTRDNCYSHIQYEEDRKFHELVMKEKRDIEKRRKGKKKRKVSKYSNVAETSFMGEMKRLTPNPSLHDDAYSEDGTSQKYPASLSMTELNKPSEGLSPRAHSIANAYRRFFPRKRPTIKPEREINNKALMEREPLQNSSNELKPDSSIHHHHQKLQMHSPSSLPNLADSGIVFDDLSNGTTSSSIPIQNPTTILPPIHQGSCSGSTTLIEEGLTNHSMLNQHLQDCHQTRNSILSSKQ